MTRSITRRNLSLGLPLLAACHDAPGIGMAAHEAVLRETGKAFVQWATSAV